MSKARVDVSATVDDVNVKEAQRLQAELQVVLETYDAEGQVALTFDNRDKQPQGSPFAQFATGGKDHHHGDNEHHEDGAPVEANSGQYL